MTTIRAAVATTARAVVTVAAVVGALCALLLVVALVLGIRPVVLRSGSMAPEMPTGALVLTVPVAAEQIAPGDVVTVQDPLVDRLVTHRVLTTEQVDGRWQATLQGDANSAPDVAAYDVTDGARRAVWSTPGVGRAIMAVRSGPWLVVGAVALVVLALIPGRRTAPQPDGSEPADDGRAGQAVGTG